MDLLGPEIPPRVLPTNTGKWIPPKNVPMRLPARFLVGLALFQVKAQSLGMLWSIGAGGSNCGLPVRAYGQPRIERRGDDDDYNVYGDYV